jgi:hypothetical protein
MRSAGRITRRRVWRPEKEKRKGSIKVKQGSIKFTQGLIKVTQGLIKVKLTNDKRL